MKKVCVILLLLVMLAACEHVNNTVVPKFRVHLDLRPVGNWNVYGVAGMGDWRYFNREKRLPANYPYTVNTYTGFGGVLLLRPIDAINPAPIAFDAACPVESSVDAIVSIDSQTLEAVCPRCKSRFNVFEWGGQATSGVAKTNNFGLRMLKVSGSDNEGYLIYNY